MAEPLSAESLEAIQQRAEKATDGPWKLVEDTYSSGHVAQRRIFTAWDHPQMHGPIGVVNSYVGVEAPTHGVAMWAEDADFLLHAREDIPALLAEVARQQQEIAELKYQVTCLVEASALAAPVSPVRTPRYESCACDPDKNEYCAMHYPSRTKESR